MSSIRTVALVLALSGSLLAQAPQGPGQNGRRGQGRPNPAQMDTNGDGKISSAEWQGPADGFARLDSNNDGYITREELRQNRPQNAGPRGKEDRRDPRAMDTNNDGKISRDEWKGASEVFDRADANHDGYITSDERPRNRQNEPGTGQNGRRPGRRGQSPPPQNQNQQ